MSSLSKASNTSGKLSWIGGGGNKKRQGDEQLAFPSVEPDQEQLLSAPKAPGRLRRILSSSKLSNWVNNSNNASPTASPKSEASPQANADRKARPRHQSASRSFFGRGKLAPLSPNLSNASTPDLSPSTSSSSSFGSNASSTVTSPALELPPQITLDTASPWSLDLKEEVFSSSTLQAALPIIESTRPQPQAGTPRKGDTQAAQNRSGMKSVWEISSDSEDESHADALKFRKRVVKRKPELATLHIPPTEAAPRPSHAGKRMSYSSASSSSSPPPSPLLGPRALYNHTCSKLRESIQPFPITSMPSSTSSVALTRPPRCLIYTLQRQAVLRKLGSPWTPGIALDAVQQREISCFTPRGGRPSSNLLSPLTKPLIDFESTSSSTTDTIVSSTQSKTVAELKQSPLLKWIERPSFAQRMIETNSDSAFSSIVGRKSAKRKFTHVIESQIALHREQAAMAKRLQDKRSSARLPRPMSLLRSPTEAPTAKLPALSKSMPSPRRAASTPASTTRNSVKEEDEDEVPLSRLLSPKVGSPASPPRPTPARSLSASRLAPTATSPPVPAVPRMPSLPRSASTSTHIWQEEQGRFKAEKAVIEPRRSQLSTSASKDSIYNNKRLSVQSSARTFKEDQSQSPIYVSKQVKEDRRRSTLLQSSPTTWAEEKSKLRPLSEPNKRRSMIDTRRHSALPAHTLLQDVVFPYNMQASFQTTSAPYYHSAPYPFTQPIQPPYMMQPIPRSTSFQHPILAFHPPQPYASQPVPISRSWSTPVLLQQ